MLKLKEFDPKILKKKSFVVAIIGGQGKSTLVADLIYNTREVPTIVMSGTEGDNQFYSKFLDDVHNEYRPNVIRDMINRDNGESVNLIMDDLSHDQKIMKSPEIEQLFINGRNYKIGLVITMGYLSISPVFQANSDYVFCFRENIKENQERLYKFVSEFFPSFTQFQEVLEEYTNNYGCLVFDNTNQSRNIEDCVFWYKATDRAN